MGAIRDSGLNNFYLTINSNFYIILNMNSKQIRNIREKLKMTQFDLAVKIGVTPTTIYLWESGKVTPSSLALEKLNDLKHVLKE